MAWTALINSVTRRFLAPRASRKWVVWTSNDEATVSTSPSITAGDDAPAHTEPKASIYLQNNATTTDQLLHLSSGGGSWVNVTP